jgi:bifunctional non-homologous end joining protein LigD
MSASRELQRQLKRIEPCLPRGAKQPPAGPGWIHEIKHDGYRIMAERNHGRVRLYSRNGYDFADRFPLAAAAIRKLPVRSCLLDGEAIVCDANGLAVFDLLRRWRGDDVVLCAFDLLELDGEDLRRVPIEERKAALAKLLRRPIDGIAFNEHYGGEGEIIYKHACARLRGDRIKAPRFDVSLRSRRVLAEGQESGGAGGHARGRGGVELGSIMSAFDRSRPARMALAWFGLVGAGVLGLLLGVVREAGWLSLLFALAFALALLLEIAGGWEETTRPSRRRLLQAFAFVLGGILLTTVAYREGWEAVLFVLIFLAIWQLATYRVAG